MTHRIHQSIDINNSANEVYATLTESTRFSAMSGGAPAENDAKAGGRFSLFGGMITGQNIECVPGKRLVQAWRAKTWDEGVYSVVRFAMEEKEGKTKVTLEHSGFPEGQGEHLAQGWTSNYLDPMQKLLG